MDLAAAYRACARVTKREARNFYYAFLSLPSRQRRAVYALYAFCRTADDVVDGSGANEAKHDELARLRERLARAAGGSPEDGPDLALADAIATFGVDPDDLADVLTGMEMDLTLRRIDTLADLRRYCYHAASAVGLATLPILNDGVPPTDAMRDAAAELGLGMQFVNILRDVAEDLERDRVYLPYREMALHRVDEAMLKGRSMTVELRSLFASQADRAGESLAHGRLLFPLLPRSGRRCPRLLAEIYGRILDRIRVADYDIFRGRVALPKHEKIVLLLSSLWRRR